MSGIVSLDCRQAGETECLSSGSLARTLEPQLKFLSYTHTHCTTVKTCPPDDVNQESDVC